MKVLIVSQHFYPESFRINDLASSLSQQGHDVTVICGLPNYPKGQLFPGFSFFKGPYREDWRGFHILRVPVVTRGSRKGLRLVLNYFSFALLGLVVGFWRLGRDYDRILIYQTSPVLMALPGVFLGRVHKIPVDLWVQDLWPQTLVAMGILKPQSLAYRLWDRFVDYLYKQCVRVFVTSQKIELLLKNKLPGLKVQYLPNWAEDIFLPNSRERAQLPDEIMNQWPHGGFNVLFAGNIGLAQDFFNLIEAADRLRDREEIYFLVAGDGSARLEAMREIKKRDLQQKFVFLGAYPLEVMPALFAKADALLVSLKKDYLFSMTAPSKLQPYMASGRPLIAALDGEGAEIVASRAQCGLAAGAGDPQGLADCILKLSSMNPKDREQLGKNGQNYYFTHFAKEKALELFLQESQ
jgi:colanic acid biosynthesis glycosyl transferase WcaI